MVCEVSREASLNVGPASAVDGTLMAHPAAFFVVIAFALLWLVRDREMFDGTQLPRLRP